MKLLIIYPSDPLGLKIGGGETFLKGFIKYCPQDIHIEYVGVTSNPTKYSLKTWTNIQLGGKEFKFFPIFTERNENKKTLIPLTLRFTAALKTIKFNYSNKIIFFNRIEPAILFRNTPCPRIVIIHSDIEKQIKGEGSEVLWSRIPWLYFMLEKRIFGFMDCIYTVSQTSADYYRKHYSRHGGKIVFLPTWVDRETFQPSHGPKITLRKALGYSEKDSKGKWILFVGRLQETKNPIRLIDSFAEHNKDYPDSCLIIIGDGNMYSKIKKYIQLKKIEKNTIIAGQMDQHKLAKYYQSSDVLLLTSNYEGMPMCILEALGCGLPVVTTDVGEVRRVVRNGFSGEVVPSFKPEDIAKALELVFERPDIYSRDNCLKAVEDYSPIAVLTPVYEKIRALGLRNKQKKE